MVKTKIKITPLAQEKLKEIVNGSKEEVLDFFKKIEDSVDKKDYPIFLSGDITGDTDFYYKKCKNIYIIFVITSNTEIGIVDFLTKIEFEKIKNSATAGE